MPTRSVSSEVVASCLEKNGWLRSVAGDEDFDKAVKAIIKMYETGRGLFLTGAAGCGKTKLITAMKQILNISSMQVFYCKNKKDVSDLRFNYEEFLPQSIVVDDIGAEEIIREYGNVVDVVGDFVQHYHYRGRGRFLATSNLNSQQINERYGGRVLDRILEMCVVMKLNGRSKRERIIF